MTGYGQFSIEKSEYILTWEIRSVNSRFLDLIFKVPHFVHSEQLKWEKIVRMYATRGRVELFLNINIRDVNMLDVGFDSLQARKMMQELQTFANDLGLIFKPDLNCFLKLSQLWKTQQQDLSEQLAEDLQSCLNMALQSWDKSRVQEGQQLKETIQDYLQNIMKDLELIEEELRDNIQIKFAKLKDRLKKLLDDLDVDIEAQLLSEFAIMVDRLDVSEELTRLRSHLKAIFGLMEQPILGKKLDFYLQECFREINTCVNKAQNIKVSQLGVNIKSNLEKLREQAQNIE